MDHTSEWPTTNKFKIFNFDFSFGQLLFNYLLIPISFVYLIVLPIPMKCENFKSIGEILKFFFWFLII